MKKSFMLLLLAVLLFPNPVAGCEEISLSAKGAILMDAASGRVLFSQNADAKYPMASTTKVMTCLLAVENCTPDEIVTAGKNAHGVPGTSIYLSEGEQLTMDEMLHGLMLRSGNDAAVAIAEHISGSVSAFSELMNARAESLGADATFINPHGLDASGHAASARALALIAREGLKNAWYREIVSTKRMTIPWSTSEYNRLLVNKNKLLSSYEGAIGIKTGFTSKAGRCLVFAAEREGLTLIGVVLNDYSWFDDARRILDWGFENYACLLAAAGGNILTSVSIDGGTQKSVNLAAAENLSCAARPGEEYSIVLHAPPSVPAPVAAGQIVGTAELVINGEVLATTDLICTDSVEKDGFLYRLSRLFHLWSAGACMVSGGF